MTLIVSLREVVGEMQMLSDDRHAYLNKVTGELIMISDDDIARAESDETDEFAEWQDELVQNAKKVLSSDEYLELPSTFDIHEYEIMERFCLSFPDEEISDVLLGKLEVLGRFAGSKIRSIGMALSRIGFGFEMRHIRKLPSPGLKIKVLLTPMI